MKRLYISANQYYYLLERFGYRELLFSGWFWFWLITVFAFLCQGALFFTSADEHKGVALFLDGTFLGLILLELLMVYLSFKLGKEKTKVVLERVNEKYAKSFRNIEDVRRFLLRRFFGREEIEYLEFSDDIQKAIQYQLQFRSPLTFGFSEMLTFIYNPDSKQRIYALLLVIVSVVTALSIRDGGGISNVFDFFYGESFGNIFLVWFLLVVFFGGFLMILLVIRLWLELFWDYLIVRIDGKAARNPHTLRYLQNDLLKYHRFVNLNKIYYGT